MELDFIKEELIKPQSNCVPCPRSGHRMVADENNLYVIGGLIQLEGGNLEVRSQLWQFNLMTNEWKQLNFLGELPDLTASHDVIMIDGDILVHGGTGTPFGHRIDNKLYVIQLDSMVCLEVPTKPKNNLVKNQTLAVYGHSLTHIRKPSNSFIYKFGGTDGYNYSNQMYRLDLYSGEWELLANEESPSAPLPRYRHETIFYKDKLYIIGGGNQFTHGFKLQKLPVFDVTSNQWQTLPTHGSAIFQEESCRVRCQSCSLVGSHVYFIGGLSENISDNAVHSSQSLFRHICQLNMNTLSWQKVGLWSRPAFFHSACSLPHLGVIYVFGGVCRCGSNTQRCNSVYKFCVPMVTSLKELSWQIVLKLLKRPYKIMTLYDLGIPDKFLKRIPSQFVSAA